MGLPLAPDAVQRQGDEELEGEWTLGDTGALEGTTLENHPVGPAARPPNRAGALLLPGGQRPPPRTFAGRRDG